MASAEPIRAWDTEEVANRWRRGAARRAQFLGGATERMLDAARVGPGMHVLDVAAGTGDQTVLAAQRVGPNGRVLATDVAASMLAAAAQVAKEAGLNNVLTKVADASQLEVAAGHFDAAICRFGLMFVPNLGEALRRVHRALKPGGRFAALVWSTEERNPWIGIQLRPIRDMNRVPSPPPSIFLTVSLSDPDVLKGAFTEAGFSDVSVSAVSTPREFHDLDEAWDAMQTTSSPSAAQFTQAMSDDERAHYRAELQRGLAALVQGDGRCVIPGEALLVVGTR